MSSELINLASRLNKPNETIVIKLEKGKLAGNGLKLHLALLFRSQQQILMGEDVPNADFMFEAAVTDLVSLINDQEDSSDLRQSLKRYFVEMMSTVVRWESPDARKNGVIWAGMPMLSFAELKLRDGKLWARWQLPGPLLRAVADPTLYTPIDLVAIAKLNSYASVALYQICSRYRHNPSGVTSKNPPDWWLDAMISTPAVDPKTKVRVVREWRKKKNSVVNDAILEINTKTDVEIQLLEFREGEGKAVTGVQFAVRQKAMPQSISSITTINDLDVVRLCTKIGISQTLIQSYIKKYSLDWIKQTLIALESRMDRDDLDAIEKPGTYFATLLREGAETLPPKKDEVKPVVEPVQVTEEPVLLRSAFTNIKEELQDLSLDVRQQYAERAFDDFKQKGLVTASMSRNLAQGNWSGPLLSKMIEIYGKERYGEDWQNLNVSSAANAEQ